MDRIILWLVIGRMLRLRFSTVGLMDALDRYRPRHGGVCRGRGQGKNGWGVVCCGWGERVWQRTLLGVRAVVGGMWTFRAGVLHAESGVPSIPMPIATPTPKVGFDVLWVGFFAFQVLTAD